MKGFYIKWYLAYECDEPEFEIYQIPAESVNVNDPIIEILKDKKMAEFPFHKIQLCLIARNKKEAIQKFRKKYNLPLNGKELFDEQYWK